MSVASQSLDLRKLPVLAKRMFDRAEYPALYKAARKAIQECARIDELKDIHDKHSALAHYAKQAKDEHFFFYAERIRLRAFEQIAVLLAELPGYRELPWKERKAIAEKSGITVQMADKAIDAAAAPPKIRDRLIEATPPPTMTQLAQAGRKYLPQGYPGQDFHHHARREEEIKRTALTAADDLYRCLGWVVRDFDELLDDRCGGRFTIAQVARAVAENDSTHFREHMRKIADWLDEFEQYLPKGDK